MDTPHQDDLPPGYEQPDRMDRLIAFFAGLASFALFWVLSHGSLHPGAWADAAVAAGLRPPESVFPCIGLWVLAGIFQLGDMHSSLVAVNMLGNVCGGLSVAFFYLVIRELLPSVLSLRSPSRFWTLRVERLVAAIGTLAFVCAGPVCQIFQSFSCNSFLLLAVLAFSRLFLRLLHYGRFSTAYGCLFLLGALTAETPFGILLTAVALVVTLVARRYAWRPDLRYLNPMLVELSKWRLSMFFFLGFAGTLMADYAFFALREGPAAAGLSNAELAVDWVKRYGMSFVDSASLIGWVLLAIFVVLPFAVAVLCARRATDDDSFLPFRAGILFVCIFFVSLAPLSILPHLRFWMWPLRPPVPSNLLLATACIALAIAFTLALAVLAYDIWCRDHKRIALQRFPELLEDGAFARRHFHWRWRRTITVVAVVLIMVAVVPWRDAVNMRNMATFVRDTLLETAAECGDAKIIVTDGALDDALRLVFAVQGKRTMPLSIMSGHSTYERNLRLAAAENDEERATLALGVSDALRNWAHDRPERLKQLAIQVGFELWRNNRAARPPASGLLAYAGLSPKDVASGTAVAHELAARAIALHACGAYSRCEDRLLKDKFLFSQWRLSRMAVIRDENAGADGDIAQAREEAKLAEKLDDLNPELRRLNDALSWIRSRDGNTLTPREGLRIALERADFALARRYATPILSADSTHPDANFGMGMSYFVEGRYAEAETYLKVALETRPDEPALLNNLAICCYRQSRFKEALEYAEKALAKLPDAPAVRKTYEQIRKTLEEKKNDAAGAK